jgi:histidine triad (HIT) family protein
VSSLRHPPMGGRPVSSESCVFCRIVREELPAEIVHADEELLAFRDVNPQAPVHLLVIPRRHVRSLATLEQGDEGLAGRLLLAARDVARREGLVEAGYRVVANVGDEGGQTVPHLHLHVLGGRTMEWPPG